MLLSMIVVYIIICTVNTYVLKGGPYGPLN